MAQPNSAFDAISKAFVQHYYQLFDTNRAGLAALYQEGSMFTFEGEQFGGSQAIMQKLVNGMHFSTVQHKVSTCDAHPSPLGNGILCFVTGLLVVDQDTNPLHFAQTFHLLPTANGSWYIQNDLFRLVMM